MRRVRAHTLVLVNWKGVFYERYTLDERVTALEGVNGAGKTTVMIAAYVAMLPDMTRLRFTNVGESDASGGDKGIWGRLGDPNRPSYTVLSFDLDGERVLAGVHLERKGEPAVELTPFLITDLPATVRLQDVLLLRSSQDDLVPELSDLKENVARLGGRLKECKTAKDYFAVLFERGITPLRLMADEERTRFNDMLRTSMTGGISRALTSEFRSFLLKEEGGLADTLVRMRANLDACRRTRTEVKESQELEREISGVFEAGHAMFAASLLATRVRALELRQRVDEALQKRDDARRVRDVVARERQERIDARSEVTQRLTGTREEQTAARVWSERVVQAHTIATRVAKCEVELRDIGEELALAESERMRAEEERGRCLRERRRAEEHYRLAASGLADLQQGLELLHFRADAHRTVVLRLGEARSHLEQPDLDVEQLDTQAASTRDAILMNDRRRSEIDGIIGGAEAHRAEHARALAALASILQREVEPVRAHEEARAALLRLSELEALARQVDSLAEEVERTQAAAERQLAVRARTVELAQPGETLASSHDVAEALRGAEAEVRSMEERARTEASKGEECARRRQAVLDEQKALQTRATLWRELDTIAARLEGTLGGALRNAPQLDAARQQFDDQRDTTQRALELLRTARMEAHEHARMLEQAGGMFHRDLLAVRDVVSGELLASHFDDVDPEQAGLTQARLGPLADAIVVEDAHVAARTIVGRERELETIWFVEGGSLHDFVEPATSDREDGRAISSTDLIIEQSGIVRTTRVPDRPTLGHAARQRLIAELLAQVAELGGRIATHESALGELASHRRDVALLTREVATLERGDPATELAATDGALQEIQRSLETHTRTADEAKVDATRLASRVDRLRDLLAEAHLLEEPDLEARTRQLEADWQAAIRARQEIARTATARQRLAEHLDALRRIPASQAEIERLRLELAELSGRRQRLFLGADALQYVAANRSAFGWSDAESSLSAQQALVPAVKAQCDRAEQEQQTAITAVEQAEEVWEKARQTWRGIDDRRSVIEASRTRAQQELDEIGVVDPSAAAVERARSTTERLDFLVKELDQAERSLAQVVGQLDERLEAREQALADSQEQLARDEKEWKPGEELWERLRAKAESNGLLTAAISVRLLETGIGAGSVNLRSEARKWEGLLLERLDVAKRGQDILDRVRAWLSGQEQTAGEDHLQAWEVVRDWLRRRVPAQVAEVDDPLVALERLRHHLAALADRLEAQETGLRGASEDVARGIDVHIRKAQRQVRLLNTELEGVHFGTIRGMRIRLQRDDRMEEILNALREGSAQSLLFATTMPIEEALQALFTRVGGRGPLLGQKLLDYREYVDIAVEIRRQSGPDWERVSASRLSTGEAIGVGTALMMVVLTAWERSANLFRVRRSLGTLRLLFLDEANRLSQDNLQVLFELCASLDLQLVIAAPEVAWATGCTTYRLARRETADGGEEVLVTGRRAIADA